MKITKDILDCKLPKKAKKILSIILENIKLKPGVKINYNFKNGCLRLVRINSYNDRENIILFASLEASILNKIYFEPIRYNLFIELVYKDYTVKRSCIADDFKEDIFICEN